MRQLNSQLQMGVNQYFRFQNWIENKSCSGPQVLSCFFPQLILTTRSQDMPPMYQVTLWPGANPNLRFQNRGVFLNIRFFLDFSLQLILTTRSQDMPPMYQVTLWPGPNPNLRFQNRVENKSCSKPSVFS